MPEPEDQFVESSWYTIRGQENRNEVSRTLGP